MFQSRAGFSECLDPTALLSGAIVNSFNPVLGFLSVSTKQSEGTARMRTGFNPVLGFLSVSTSGPAQGRVRRQSVSIPCWVF